MHGILMFVRVLVDVFCGWSAPYLIIQKPAFVI